MRDGSGAEGDGLLGARGAQRRVTKEPGGVLGDGLDARGAAGDEDGVEAAARYAGLREGSVHRS